MTTQTLTKFCPKCQSEKSTSKFSKDESREDGLQIWCKRCKKDYRQANKEKISKWEKEYRHANKDSILVRNKEYREANKDVILVRNKKYRQSDKGKETVKRFYENNPDYMKKYRQSEKGRKFVIDYRQSENGKNARKKADHKRRALKLGATVEDFNPIEIFERDGYRCQLCGKKTRPDYKNSNHLLFPNLDHIIPLGKGGEHSRLNTQCTCHLCNLKKHDKEDFGDQQRLFG